MSEQKSKMCQNNFLSAKVIEKERIKRDSSKEGYMAAAIGHVIFKWNERLAYINAKEVPSWMHQVIILPVLIYANLTHSQYWEGKLCEIKSTLW